MPSLFNLQAIITLPVFTKVLFQYRVKIPQTPTSQDHAEEENLGQDAVPESGETQESSCKAENNSRTGKSDEKMGITELKNYHPVTGISNFFFCHLSHFHLLLMITFRCWVLIRYKWLFFSYFLEMPYIRSNLS